MFTMWQVAFLGGSAGKNPPAMQMKVPSQVGDDFLQKEMATSQYSCLENSHGQRSLECYSP